MGSTSWTTTNVRATSSLARWRSSAVTCSRPNAHRLGGGMANRDHNPHHRRLYLPIVGTGGTGGDGSETGSATATVEPLEPDTHVAHSVGCAQTARPAGRKPAW